MSDFIEIQKLLYKVSKPKKEPTLNIKKMKEFIKLHKKENQKVVADLLKTFKYVDFQEFNKQAKHCISIFNQKVTDYIIVVGSVTIVGSEKNIINIEKSNFWMIVLYWKYLAKKPIDIIFSLETAFSFYPKYDYAIFDDSMYSGNQVVDGVLATAQFEYIQNYINSTSVINEIIIEKKKNIYLIIPYVSSIAFKKLSTFQQLTSLNVCCISTILTQPLRNLLNSTQIRTVVEFENIQLDNLLDKIPIFFQHKIPDNESTLSDLLTKGWVLDNETDALEFINECIYNEDEPDTHHLKFKKNMKKFDCIIPPYKKYYEYLEFQSK